MNAPVLCSPKPIFKQTHSIPIPSCCPKVPQKTRPLTGKLPIPGLIWNLKPVIGIVGSALAFALVAGSASAFELPLGEPANALSLPTWAIHVSSVVEWIVAMGLVWQYGQKSGFESWKGLSWGMVPLLSGAFCACTWHFFYNSESLEVLVVLQAALTVIGNATMCYAAFRICKLTDEHSQKLCISPSTNHRMHSKAILNIIIHCYILSFHCRAQLGEVQFTSYNNNRVCLVRMLIKLS